jgi:methylmalonyl-CoA/ethylmalonyl-CoA epimerase
VYGGGFMKFHHLGIATENLKQTLEWIKNTFEIKHISDIVFDKNQNASLVLIETKDMVFELISGDIVKNLINKNITYYHICYEVKSIEKTVEKLNGILISPPKNAVLFNNKRVCFVMTNIGLIELLEE